MSVTLRSLQPEDWDAIVALWLAAWAPVFPTIDFTARQEFLRERLRLFSRPPRLARGAFAPEAGLLGFALSDCLTGDLEQIAVAPEAQGRGIADLLLDDAARQAQGPLRLTVNRDNPRALAFYRRKGFRIIGEGRSETSGLPILLMEQGLLADQAENCSVARRE